jgi:hypothetical protein
MPKRDPNKIDVKEALRIYNVWRDWNVVAEVLKRPNGLSYTTDAICKAVRRHDRMETA